MTLTVVFASAKIVPSLYIFYFYISNNNTEIHVVNNASKGHLSSQCEDKIARLYCLMKVFPRYVLIFKEFKIVLWVLRGLIRLLYCWSRCWFL